MTCEQQGGGRRRDFMAKLKENPERLMDRERTQNLQCSEGVVL
jgi:hypothetical protein